MEHHDITDKFNRIKSKFIEIEDEESNESEIESEDDKEQTAYFQASDSEEGEIKYPYVNAIKNVINMVVSLGNFACGEILENPKGVGEVKQSLHRSFI